MKNVENIYALSPMQQGMLFHRLYAPESNVYLFLWIFTLQGDLNVSLFKEAWQRVVEKYAVLRTCFVWEDVDEPVQIVRQQVTLPWEEFDWRGRSSPPQKEQIEEYVRQDRKRGLVLTRAPVMRLSLIRLSDNTYKFICSLHHILADGWSTAILFDEVFSLYESLYQGREPQLTPTRPYADYIFWLQQQDLSAAERFWRSTLKGFTAPTKLPIGLGHSLPQGQEEPTEQRVLLSPNSTAALQSFARRHKLTINTLVQGAWALLCARYSGEEDVVFGGVVNGRPTELIGADSMVGLFINTLPVRVKVCSQDLVLPWLEKLQIQQVEQRQYDYSPLIAVQQWSKVAPGSPLFENILAFQNYPVSNSYKTNNRSLHIERDSYIERTNYPLTITASLRKQLSLKASYDRLRLDDSKVVRMLGHFENLLEGIVSNPEERLSLLPLLTDAERQQLLVEWNDTTTQYPRNLCVHELFEAQVERTPDAIAVVFEDEQLTYGQLNVRANQVAHYLRKRGVEPGALVGICVERSTAMVVGILGILKAGGAYVPLDFTYPKERLAFMLKDVQAPVLLTQKRLLGGLPKHEAEVVCLDTDWEEIAGESEENPVSGAMAENLAYVIYTSGSTGKPKGVAVPHQAVTRLVFNTNYVNLEPSDRVAQASNSSFDAATFELWGALLRGARLVGITKIVTLSPQDFAAQIRQKEISAIFLTTALFNQLASEVPGVFNSVRHVLFGGEAVDPRWVKEVLKNGPPERLVHVYGPTENTTFSTWYLVQDVPEGASNVPIGRAISNTQVYVLDAHLQMVPIGVAGELYIGGDGLARGYLNRPELTAERFIPSPFSNTPGDTLYKTGDLVRCLPDGNLEFVSRIDHQVKLRGYRIELAEIETILREHTAVQDAVVIVRDSEGNKILVSYVVVNPSDSALPEPKLAAELKSFLKNKLPDYMVPAYFSFLEKLPLTPSGKIDRSALPAADGTRPELEAPHVAPRDDLERRLARIWEKLLGVHSVGIRDNFFDLGGHSLLAVRVVSEIEKEIGQRLPLVSFFQGANIEYLAGLLRQDVSSLSWPTLIEIQSGGPNAPLFCVSMPNVNALGYRSLARYLGPDQPVFGLQGQYPEDLDGEHSYEAGDRIATEYLEALRAVRPMGPYQLIGLCRGAHIAYEMARRLEKEGQQVAFLGILDTWVIENTYNFFWFVEQSASRLYSLTRVGPRKQLSFIGKKVKSALKNLGGKISPFIPAEAVRRKRNPIYDMYFPGPDFVPRTYEGRIAVFRVRRQPRHRIRDPHLGWGRLARGGVDIHFIPGRHTSVLKEPNVQVLAAELKKCLLRSEQVSS